MNSAFISYSASFINCPMYPVHALYFPWGRGVLPYIRHKAMCLRFLDRFGLKTGINFAHFGLESGMVYEGTTVLYQCVSRFNYN